MAPDVSIILPVYNEKDTLREVIETLLELPIDKEIIVVDDASTDGSADVAAQFGDRIVLLRQPTNQGKGSAIRAALAAAKGEVAVIQDADLEYDPADLPKLVQPILDGRADVVYGSRFMHGMNSKMAFANRLVNRLLVAAVRVLYFRRITDEATCYKAVRTSVLKSMHLECRRFEFCPEVTAKAIRMGLEIEELPVRYEPRTKGAGKKIRWTDGVEAFWTLLKHRFRKF
ncbi:MAG TPA: glycosyltransferase family 2 protein [Fimbriimonadales bacterium]|jgi:glycosyltransferase involved in cell wall biosynthesis|nr:glycosyltransferase family 2 protein [Fimbriimonadales bacterium]